MQATNVVPVAFRDQDTGLMRGNVAASQKLHRSAEDAPSQRPPYPGTPRHYTEHMQHLAQMEMTGDSMAPTIKHGDILYIDPEINCFDGDNVYVVDRGNGPEVRRVQYMFGQGGGLMLICDNKAYQAESTEFSALKILGIVLAIITARGV